MDSDERYADLIEHLRQKNHSDKDIELILNRVREYESRVQCDSVMDAIGDGTLDIEGLVKEALGE